MSRVAQILCSRIQPPLLPLDPPRPTGPAKNHRTQRNHDANDTKEWSKVSCVFERHWDVHAEQTAYQVQRYQDRGKERDLAENAVGICALRYIVDGQSREVVAMGARQHLLEVAQVRRHCYNVILNIAQVHADVHAGGDLIILVAPLREATEHVSLTSEKPKECHAILPDSSDGPQKRTRIILTHHKHLVLYGVSLDLNLADNRRKTVNNVVSVFKVSMARSRYRKW